jgi:hydroxyacylglutathione hydrolase
MGIEVTIIASKHVNCFLLKSGEEYFLIDTGFASDREGVSRSLEKNGCRPGQLKLIIVTHADSDHVGNCRFLRDTHGAKILMHRNEVEAVKSGDAAASRTLGNDFQGILSRLALSLFFRLKEADRFTPDEIVDGADDLDRFGLEANILPLPGHTNGSIGILTAGGGLFCGDLLMNQKKVAPGIGIFDRKVFKASIETLKKSNIQKVYPGHGKPFTMEALLNNKRFQ